MASKIAKPSAGEPGPAKDAATEQDAPHARTPRFSPAKVGFLRPALGVVALWPALAAAQTAADRIATVGWDPRTLGLVAVVSAFTMMLGYVVTRWPQDSYRYLASTYASVVWIAAIAIGTALGTVVLQGADSVTFMARYPNAGTALRALCLDDVFHSWPFRAVGLGLLLSSLATVIQRRKTIYKWRHIGLLSTHISLLIIVVGGMWGSSHGGKGMVHLRVGQSNDTMILSGGPHAGEPVKLPFALRLDKFELSHHTPDFRLYTWEKKADGRTELLSSDPPRVGQPAGLQDASSPISARVTRVFQRAQPVKEAPPPGTVSGHVITGAGGEQIAVEPGKQYVMKDGVKVSVDAFYPDFYFDMQARSGASRSDEPNNPVLTVRMAGEDGAWSQPRFLFGREDLRMRMTGSHDGAGGLTYQFTRASGRIIGWEEGKEGAENPAVEIEVTRNGTAHREMRFASQPEPLYLAEHRAVFFEEKSDSIRNYRSNLTVLQGGSVLAQKLVEVNDPLYLGDYGLYQSNFDPKDPEYSGILVVNDPGMGLSMFGLWLLVAGILQAITLRNWEPWWERRGVRERAAGNSTTTQAEAHA